MTLAASTQRQVWRPPNIGGWRTGGGTGEAARSKLLASGRFRFGQPPPRTHHTHKKGHTTMTIPTAVVTSKEYLLDPESEDLIWGDQLEEGMIVLVDGMFRGTSLDPPTGNLESDRWCQITNLRWSGHLVKFIGVYADGSKLARTYHTDFAWYVKKVKS